MFWCVSYNFGAFWTVWLLTKLGAKWAELVQKFVPRSRVGIFRNERTQSIPLDPRLMFWCISYNFGALGRLVELRNSVQNRPNWSKSSCHEVASEFFPTNACDPPHWTLNSCFGAFRIILKHFGPFGCHTNSVHNGPKWCKSSCHEVASEIFAMKAPDPPHWTLNKCFGAFHKIWVHL